MSRLRRGLAPQTAARGRAVGRLQELNRPANSIDVLHATIAASMLLSPAATTAEPKPAAYELRWEAPQGCPDAEQLREWVAELVPNPAGGDGVMFVEGTVVEGPDGFTLSIATDFVGRQESRTVESGTCADLGDATALVIAVALEPELSSGGDRTPPQRPTPRLFVPEPGLPHAPQPRVQRGPPSPSPSERPRRQQREPPPREPESEANSRPARPPDAVLLRLGPGAEYGSLPRVGGGASLTVGLRWPRWRAELFGTYQLPQRRTFGTTRSRFDLGTAGGRGCRRLLAPRVEFPICLGLEAGGLRAQTEQQSPRSAVSLVWLAPSASGGVAVGGERVGFYASGELAVPVVLPRVSVGSQEAFRSRPVSLRGFAGLEFFFAIDPG